MAMIKCPECGKEISDKASTCPNCGSPVSTINAENRNQGDANNKSIGKGNQSLVGNNVGALVLGSIAILPTFIALFQQ